MSKRNKLTSLIVGLLVLACLGYGIFKKYNSLIFPGLAYDLTSTEINELSVKARKGDSQAITQLVNYYMEYDELNGKKKAVYWLELGAKSGNSQCQYDLAGLYETMGDYEQAKKWYKVAEKNGHPKAYDDLKRLKALYKS